MKIGRNRVLFVLLVLVLLVVQDAGGAGIPVTGCRKITAPGTYVLQNDIINSDAPVCINITSSDVTLLGNGHTVDGQDAPHSWGIYSTAYTNTTILDIVVTDWEIGIFVNTINNAVRGSAATGNRFGIFTGYRNNTVSGCRAVNNSQTGIYAWGNEKCSITENLIRENPYLGLYLGYSYNCTVRDNRIEDNGEGGIFVGAATDNLIVNNYFNNTLNYRPGSTVEGNTWNVSRVQGVNIAGGPYLAGNFWARPGGDGFSQTCPDSNYDGICNSAYTLDAENIDRLPLSPKILRPLPGYSRLPLDPDGDGIYEDLNGNGRKDFADIVLYFNYLDWIAANEPVEAFDLNGNGRIDFADIVALFNEI